jgi:protein-tyrosine phosphatase
VRLVAWTSKSVRSIARTDLEVHATSSPLRGIRMRTEVYWVNGPWPGRLAIMPRPRGGDWLEDEIGSWRRSGVDVVVSLLTVAEIADLGLAEEERLCAANGMQFFSFPIEDRGVPSSPEAFSDLAMNLVGELVNGKKVAVHCRQGIGRASLVAICLLILSEVKVEAAIERTRVARGCVVPETPEQMHWVMDFAAARAYAPEPRR